MGKIERLDQRRRGTGHPAGQGKGGSGRFDSLLRGESREAVCALCGGAGRVWRDEQGLLQQRFEHEDPCLLDVLMRHVAEEFRLKLGLGIIQRRLMEVELTDRERVRDTNLLVTGWVNRLLAGEDIALSSYEPADGLKARSSPSGIG